MVKRYFIASLIILMTSLLVASCGIPQEDYAAALAEAMATKAQVSSMQIDLSESQSDLDKAKNDLNVSQSRASILQDDLEEAERDLAEALGQLSPLKSQVSLLQSEASSMQDKISSLETSLASAEVAIALRQAQVLDQAIEPSWSGGFAYLNPINQVGQSFIPRYPILTAVEVMILTASPERGDDSITMKILDSNDIVLASRVIDVASGFDGWLLFEIEGGIEVPEGIPLVIRLEDTGNSVFGWRLIPGDQYPFGSTIIEGSSEEGDFLFRTYGIPVE
jgi:hypothetical protein